MLPSLSYFFDLSDFEHADLFAETHFPWEALQRLENYLNGRHLGLHKGTVSSSAYLINPDRISIGPGSIVEPGAYIAGPCVIGSRCVVRHGAYIRGNVLTGDDCVIGHDSELKQTILLNRAHAAHFAYVGDSILGNRVNLGAGVKCANFKLDHSPVDVRFEGGKIATGLRKFGALIGDGCQIGCNGVTNPGTLIGQNVFCHPCLNVRGFIPSESVVRAGSDPVVFLRNQSIFL